MLCPTLSKHIHNNTLLIKFTLGTDFHGYQEMKILGPDGHYVASWFPFKINDIVYLFSTVTEGVHIAEDGMYV